MVTLNSKFLSFCVINCPVPPFQHDTLKKQNVAEKMSEKELVQKYKVSQSIIFTEEPDVDVYSLCFTNLVILMTTEYS